jgi:ferredoxin
MALMITAECINCAACEDECPNHAISLADLYVIDPTKCTECVGHEEAPRCIPVCPAECIQIDPTHVEDLSVLRARYETLYGTACPEIGSGLSKV